MPCDPSQNSLFPPLSGGPGFPLFSPFQPPTPDLDLPTELLENIRKLIEQLGALFPSGLFKPNPDFGMKNIMDAIADLLSQLAPFLSFYNFIFAALRLIICIIEVLCAIPNPFAVAEKLRVLFAECLPPFLNLLPWLALIAMIIAFILLIIALILYIIETIIKIIEAIIRNIILLGDGVALKDATATLAAAQKIASLLCFIENLLAIFIAIAAIIGIIRALAAFAGLTICDDEDPAGCCSPEICPPFIKNNREINVPTGELVYHSQIGIDVSTIPAMPGPLADLIAAALAPIRKERWQLLDTQEAPPIPVNSIITPIIPLFLGGTIYYPDQEFDQDTAPIRSPYTVDVTMTLDPRAFHPTDTLGERIFIIKDCVVVRKPYVGLYNFAGILSPGLGNTNGTFNIEGGLVTEEDGTEYVVDGYVASLNTFISMPSSFSDVPPAFDDGYTISNLSFVWKPQHGALASHDLITVGCMPEVNIEKAVQNAIILAEGITPVLDRLPPVPSGVSVASSGDFLPNVTGAEECVLSALATFRKEVSVAGAADFQAQVEVCLNDLLNQSLFTLCAALLSGTSQFKSTVEIEPNLQFTTGEITTSVVLKDAAGTVISKNLPVQCSDSLEDKLKGEVTLGEITKFTYDGYEAFNAYITSEISGDGELTVSFDGNIFSTVIAGTEAAPTSIIENITNYTFVDDIADEQVRRDETDAGGS